MSMLNSSQSKFLLSQSRSCPMWLPEQGKMRQMTDMMSYMRHVSKGRLVWLLHSCCYGLFLVFEISFKVVFWFRSCLR